MKINSRSIAAGLTVGVLAGGAGGAIAATTSGSRTASPSSTTMRATGGWGGYGHGPDGGGAGWHGPATGSGWGAWGNDGVGMPRMSFARAGRQAAQTYLGLSASQLRSRLQTGTTLAEIASNQGKSVAGLESAIESAVTDAVNADSALSARRRSSIIADLTPIVDSVVTGTWDGAGGSWHGGPTGPMTSAGW